MLPAQRNKVDISSLTEEEQKLFRLYGKLPTRKDVIGNKLKERKYFDSGDYALSKAGKAPQQSVGTAIPNPEMIPHASTVSSPPACTTPSVSSGITSPIAVPGVGVGVGAHSSSPNHANGASSIAGGASAAGGAGGGGGAAAATTTAALGRPQPQVSAFPTATGFSGGTSGSPAKESSSLGKAEVAASDLMEE